MKSDAVIILHRIEIRCYNIGRANGTAQYLISDVGTYIMDVLD